MSNVFHPYQLGDDFVELVDKTGRTWKFAPLTVGQRFRIQSRLRDKLPDPMKLYHEARQGEPADVAAKLFQVAAKERAFWPPPVESCGIQIAETPELRTDFIREMLTKNQPGVTTEEAAELAEEMNNNLFGFMFVFATTGLRPDDPNRSSADQVPAAPTGSN